MCERWDDYDENDEDGWEVFDVEVDYEQMERDAYQDYLNDTGERY